MALSACVSTLTDALSLLLHEAQTEATELSEQRSGNPAPAPEGLSFRLLGSINWLPCKNLKQSPMGQVDV